jgi:hypothetical protein
MKNVLHWTHIKGRERPLGGHMWTGEYIIAMDIKEKADRERKAFIRLAEDGGPVAGPGFT